MYGQRALHFVPFISDEYLAKSCAGALPANLSPMTAHLDALAAIARWHTNPADDRLKAEVDDRRRALRRN